MNRENDKNKVNVLFGKQYQKSNALVHSKGRASSVAYKLFALGIHKVKEEPGTGILYAELYGTELRKIFKKNGGSFYEQIKQAVTPIKDRESLLDYRVVFFDDITKRIEAINVVTDCKFEKGILSMRFNNKVNDQIYRLNSNYTVFSLEELIPLKNIYSIKLYELLKSEYDYQYYIQFKKNTKPTCNPTYCFEINLIDLKLQLGIININANDELLKAVEQINPDFELIHRLATSQHDYNKYYDFGAFKRTVLDVPQKELEKKTSMRFTYETITAGKGGRVVAIRFFINKVTNDENITSIKEEKNVLMDDEKMEIIFEVKTLVGNDFSAKEIREITELAKYDFDKVKNAYSLMQANVTKIDSPIAWMKSAIKDGYEKPKAKNSFNNFKQNSYDFEELEKKLLDN